MPMVIKVVAQRDPDEWSLYKNLKPIEVPSTWPKGQSVLDRAYWCDVALGQSAAAGFFNQRVSGLLNQAIGLL